jgi:hypothetical protein
MNSLDAFWGHHTITNIEKRSMNKTEAKDALMAARFETQQSGAKRFEVTVIIKELTRHE